MKVIKVPFIKGTPARTNRKTGVIYISEWHFNKFDKIIQEFIIIHEMAHYLFKTKDEQLCDEFATQMLLKKGYRLKKILHAITDTLSNSNFHYARKMNVLNQLRIYDYINNHNVEVLEPIK